MSKVNQELYDRRTQGVETHIIIITVADQPTAESFEHEGFERYDIAPLDAAEPWMVIGALDLAHLEELESDERVLQVYPESQPEKPFSIQPVGEPIEFDPDA